MDKIQNSVMHKLECGMESAEWQYIWWSDVTYLWLQYDRHFVGQHCRTVLS